MAHAFIEKQDRARVSKIHTAEREIEREGGREGRERRSYLPRAVAKTDVDGRPELVRRSVVAG